MCVDACVRAACCHPLTHGVLVSQHFEQVKQLKAQLDGSAKAGAGGTNSVVMEKVKLVEERNALLEEQKKLYAERKSRCVRVSVRVSVGVPLAQFRCCVAVTHTARTSSRRTRVLCSTWS